MFKSFLNRLFKNKSILWYGIFAIAIIVIDRFSKIWAVAVLTKNDISIFPGFTLALSINRGISFNLLSTNTKQGTTYLILLILSVFIGFIAYTFFGKKKTTGLIPELFVLAGAASNICDRFIYGGVIDFLLLYVANWHWPTFNIADCAIFIGISLIFIRSLRDNKN